MLSAFRQDAAYALRGFRHRPGFAAVALVTLALGIGANTAIFTVVHAVLLRGLPYPDADRIVRIHATYPKYAIDRGVMNGFDIDYLQKHANSLDALAAATVSSTTLTGAGDPIRLRTANVMPAFFDIVGTYPETGRAFSSEEAIGKARVAVISHRLWATRFGSRADIVGQPISLDDRTWTVVGVMPERFLYPEIVDVDMLRPLELSVAERTEPGSWYLGTVARLKPGVTVADAQAEADRLYTAITAIYPKQRSGRGLHVMALRDDLASRAGDGLRLLQGVVVCVLLIACANVANLLLAQSASRRREFAVRTAVGASRGRMIRQVLSESVTLALAGAALGSILAVFGVRVLVAMAPPFLLPAPDTIGVSWPALLFTAAVAIGTGILFGIVPALGSATPYHTALSSGQRTASAGLSWSRRQGLRAGLVATEVALSLVLVAGSLLLVRSFALLLEQRTGFRTERLMTAQVTLPVARYTTEQSRAQFWLSLVDGLRAIPGVEGAVGSSGLPFTKWEWQTDFALKGREAVPNDGAPIRTVTAGYFEVMGVPLLRGRGITSEDTAASQPVAVVSDAFVRQHMAGLDPIGQQITFNRRGSSWFTIVGVVGSTRDLRLDEAPRPEIYRPLTQEEGTSTLIVAARASGDPAALAPAFRDVVRRLDPNLPVQELKTMDQLIASNVAERRFNMVLLSAFASLAAVLAVVGVYGVMSYVVSQGRREIGIRLALGAKPGQVSAGVIAQGVTVIGVGAAAGLVGAVTLTRLLQSQLFSITPRDPLTLGATTAALVAVATLACWIPARRTASVDPASILRAE